MREAIILAGGLGTRLSQVVPNEPKPMARVIDTPFLELLLNVLLKKKFSRIILSVGYKAEMIIAYFGDNYRGMELVYQRETAPLGTGGAIAQALPRCIGDHVFVINGDTFLDFEVDDLEFLWDKKKQAIMTVKAVQEIGRFGSLKTKEGYLVAFNEKGASGEGLINAGCYLLPTNFFPSNLNLRSFSFERDYLMKYINEHRIWIYESSGYFIDIGVPEDYFLAQTTLKHYIN
jgi:D-glycero-alpha-D-manno-heptose 1-phosphate guanylyltransferase